MVYKLPTIVSTETATDVAGTYTAYTYSDGHVETDPPGRPFSKEDLQRQRLAQAAQQQAQQMLSATLAKLGVPSAPASPAVQRQNQGTVSSTVLIGTYHDYLDAAEQIAGTASAPPQSGSPLDQLLTSFGLGGPAQTPASRPEFGLPDANTPISGVPDELQTPATIR
jgi:hypothetical protein